MACLDDATVDHLIAGRLDEPALRAVEAHLDRCDDCSVLVSTLAGGTTQPLPGEAIGKHTILSTLGRGAMGVVYLAHDPELDRRVALKLLRPGSRGADLLAEAQAMAKLSHPNVATVYEVGRAGADLYIAMEHVAGGTLRAWLRDAKPSEPAILEALVQAGAGLSAAHRAGLVHRDLKPENILRAEDGRVRVSDFGLASFVATDSRSGIQGARLVGTPAYMAPEQLDGREATPASDQFALAVCVWEALAGTRPFSGDTAAELRAAIARGPNLSALASKPRRVRQALVRALSLEEQRRFPSLDALCEALRPARNGSSVTVAAVALGAAALTTGLLLLAPKPARTETEAALELPPIAERNSVESPLVADPRPSDATTAAALDELERELARLAATNAGGMGNATLAEARALVERARAIGYRPTLAEAALFTARLARQKGMLEVARAFANEAQAAAEAARADGAAARAWLEVLAIAGQSGRLEDAEEHLRRADAAITRVGDPPTLRAAWSLQQGLTHTALGRFDAALPELEQAQRWAEQVHGPDSSELARVLTALGDLARQTDKLDQALALHTRALELDSRVLGEQHPEVARHHHNLAGVLRRLGRQEAALASYQRARALELLLGARQPSVGLTDNSIGLVLAALGKPREARASFEQAESILREANDPDQAHPLLNLAELDVAEGHTKEAIDRLGEAVGLLEANLGKTHPRARAARERRDELRATLSKPRPVSTKPASSAPSPKPSSYGGSTRWGD